MKTRDNKPAAAEDGKETSTLVSRDTVFRREFLAGTAVMWTSLRAVTWTISGSPECSIHREGKERGRGTEGKRDVHKIIS